MSNTISINDVVSQMEGNIASDMDGEKVMLSIKNGKYYNLGETGGEIWDCIREPILIYDLIQSLIEKYEIEESNCSGQTIEFIYSLLQEGLVQVNSV